jgi:hypothetical protein
MHLIKQYFKDTNLDFFAITKFPFECLFIFFLSSQIDPIFYISQLQIETWQELELTSNGLAPQVNEPQVFRSPLQKKICSQRSNILGVFH